MTERLLQFIWQFQYFNRSELTVETGQELQVFFAGQFNQNQGPDFLEAKIRIGETTWVGNIELHLRSSDWSRHAHDQDQNYNNVVLHVVWENDVALLNQQLPLLILQPRVSNLLLSRYEGWLREPLFIPCEKQCPRVANLQWTSWKTRLAVERLARKTLQVDQYLEQTNQHWEEAFWWLIARNFGYAINADAFEAVARSIPLNLLAKHKNRTDQLEALLFGQAGLIPVHCQDDYVLQLKREYEFLRVKYRLESIHYPVHFLRMRPGNFPTIRLAQLAALVHKSLHLFSLVRDAPGVDDIRSLLSVTADHYWNTHFRFGEAAGTMEKVLGRQFIDSVIINTIVPMLFAYGHHRGQDQYKQKALDWLENTPSENNSIITGWTKLGVGKSNALETQGLTELKKEYCDRKRCLECGIGIAILKGMESGSNT